MQVQPRELGKWIGKRESPPLKTRVGQEIKLSKSIGAATKKNCGKALRLAETKGKRQG